MSMKCPYCPVGELQLIRIRGPEELQWQCSSLLCCGPLASFPADSHGDTTDFDPTDYTGDTSADSQGDTSKGKGKGKHKDKGKGKDKGNVRSRTRSPTMAASQPK
jgi:hypothetical protein